MIKELLAYQNADAKLRKIEKELGASTAKKKAASARAYIEGVNDNVNKLDDRAQIVSNESLSLFDEQKKLAEQLSDIEKAIDSANDENEVNYLSKKADELLSQIKALAQKITKSNEDASKIVKEYAGIKSQTKTAQTQYAEAKEEYDKLKESFKDQIVAINNELEGLKKSVDATLMEKYDKKRANKIFPIVYEVTDSVCGACRMELSMLELNKLKNGEIIECDQCGRLLYQNVEK